MKFETKSHKFLGRWTYQAQFSQHGTLNQIKGWFSGRNVGEYELVGDCFYTNELQDIFMLRIQFDRQLKAIRQFVTPPQ